jgi:succinate-acetate transporter protein
LAGALPTGIGVAFALLQTRSLTPFRCFGNKWQKYSKQKGFNMANTSKSVATTTIGYMCLALTGWMISMPNASWFSRSYSYGDGMLYPLAIVLAIMGILSFFQGRGLDAIIFFGGTGLFWSNYVHLTAANNAGIVDPPSYAGWYVFIWAVFFCYVWLGSFKSGIIRFLFLLGLWLTLLALAIGNWGSLHGITILGGYLGLITSILAAIVSAFEVISYGRKFGDPNRDAATELSAPSPRAA